MALLPLLCDDDSGDNDDGGMLKMVLITAILTMMMMVVVMMVDDDDDTVMIQTVMKVTDAGLTMMVALLMREISTTGGYARSERNGHDGDHVCIMRFVDLSAC